MFRNIYLESYKNSIQANGSIEILLTHFNHVYSTLGSILNDMEFAIGKLIANATPSADTHRQIVNETEHHQMAKQMNNLKNHLDEFKLPGPKKDLVRQSKNNRFQIEKPVEYGTRNNKRNQAPAMNTNEFQQLFHQIPHVQNNSARVPMKKPGDGKMKEEKRVSASEDFFDQVFANHHNQFK